MSLASKRPYIQWGQITGDPDDQIGQSFYPEQIKQCTTQLDSATDTTLSDIPGLTGFSLVAGGIYLFDIHLAGVATANGGHKVAFKYTTAVLAALESMARGFTASAVAVQRVTNVADQTPLFALTAAATIAMAIRGRFTVTTGGTLALQAAQNASHADTSSIYTGSHMILKRIG